MPYTKESLKKHSGGGFGGTRTKLEVPTIKFNGNTGKLSRFNAGDYKNATDLPESIELTILRPRRMFTSFEKTPDGPVRLFTNEHNTWKDHVTVFEARQGKKVKAVGKGMIEDLRQEFPSLRINSMLYVLYEGVVHKMNIRGKSRQMLVDFSKMLTSDKKELFETKIKLTPTQEQGTGGNTYFYLNFESTEAANLEEIGPHMEKIGETFDKIDAEYTDYNSRVEEEQSAVNEGAASGPAEIPIDNKEDKGEEMKVEDIPF